MRKLSLLLILPAAVVSLVAGVRYMMAAQFMTYHAAVSGIAWLEESLYRERLERLHEIAVLTPDEADRGLVHRVIFDELCLGIIQPESRAAYRDVMQRLVDRGAQAVILGCTEISLLVRPEDASVPMFDTTALHARAAAKAALADT